MVLDTMTNLKLIESINTREELINALATGDKVSIVPTHPNKKLIGTIHSVERDVGSGYSFHVGLYVKNSLMQQVVENYKGVSYTPGLVLKTVYISFPSPTSRPVRQTPKESPKPRPRTRLGA